MLSLSEKSWKEVSSHAVELSYTRGKEQCPFGRRSAAKGIFRTTQNGVSAPLLCYQIYALESESPLVGEISQGGAHRP